MSTKTQPSRIGITITDPFTISKLTEYKEKLSLDYADTVRLALRNKLPPITGDNRA